MKSCSPLQNPLGLIYPCGRCEAASMAPSWVDVASTASRRWRDTPDSHRSRPSRRQELEKAARPRGPRRRSANRPSTTCLRSSRSTRDIGARELRRTKGSYNLLVSLEVMWAYPKSRKKQEGPVKNASRRLRLVDLLGPLMWPASTTRTGSIGMRCNKFARSSGSRRNEDKKDD